MAVLYPDILQHNNPNQALVDSTSLRGNAYPINVLNDTGSIPSDKRQVGMLVFTSGSKTLYGFFGQTTSSGDWDTTSNWKNISTGSGGGGSYPGDSPDRINGTATANVTSNFSSSMTFASGSNFNIGEWDQVNIGANTTDSVRYITLQAWQDTTINSTNNTTINSSKENIFNCQKARISATTFIELKTPTGSNTFYWNGIGNGLGYSGNIKIASSGLINAVTLAHDYYLNVPGIYKIPDAESSATYKIIFPLATDWIGQTITLIHIDNTYQANMPLDDGTGNFPKKNKAGSTTLEDVTAITWGEILTFTSDGTYWWRISTNN